MRRSDFRYELPQALIAQSPAPDRTAARMLCLDPLDDALRDAAIAQFPQELEAGDLLVLNDTRVIPARLFGRKASGGRVEILIERLLSGREALAQVRASKPPHPGTRIAVEGAGAELLVRGRTDEFYRLELIGENGFAALLDAAGHVPLPPYIHRPDRPGDRARYQTVYARRPGAVAAPTAGLHFDQRLLAAICARGIAIGFVTLHVGAGTFQPVRAEDLSRHRMHGERAEVSETVCDQIERAKVRGRRVVAVGTTVVRALESAARSGAGGRLAPYRGETDLFILPGYTFRAVDALLTNFHLPESTLLMLVCAFAGRERVLAAYAHAVRERYRFYSYGDAMWIPRRLA